MARTSNIKNRKSREKREPEIPKRQVFISYHDCDADRPYKERFTELLKGSIIDKSVHDDDIDDNPLKTETVRQRIRDEFIRGATVTVVLIGNCTWQRKHVDWEIGSSLRATKKNSRCGLVGILLPSNSKRGNKTINPRVLPPKLAINLGGDDPYAKIYNWPKRDVTRRFRRWINEAFERRKGTNPSIGKTQFKKNRSGNCNRGWKDPLRVPKRVKLR